MNSCDILSHPYRNSLIGFGLLMGSIPAYAITTYQFETSPVSVGVGVDQNAITDTPGSFVTRESPIRIGDKLSASLTFASPLAPSHTTHLSAESGGFDLIGNNGPTQGNVEAYSTSVVYLHPITSDLNQYHPFGSSLYDRYSTLDGDVTTDASGKISAWDLTFTLLKANGGAPFGISTNPPGFVGDPPSQVSAYLHINSNPNSHTTIHNVSSINEVSQAPGTNYSFNGKDTAFLDSAFPGVGQYRFYTTSPIPEPSTWALMIAGLGLLGGWQQRRLRRD